MVKLSSVFLILLFFSSIRTAPTSYDKIHKQLNDLSKQVELFAKQFNQSVDFLANKIDENTHELMDLIKTHHVEHHSDEESSSHRPVSALLIIDVQNDFIDGSLALKNCPAKQNGAEVVPVINELINKNIFDVVAYSSDWHPTDHISFFDNLHLRSHLLANDSTPENELNLYSIATFEIPDLPRMQQTLWPRHCVQNSDGAKLHSDLKFIDEQTETNASVIHIYKGTKSDIDSYSAFWDNSKLSETTLHQQLQEKHVNQVFITGLATDWCVYFTALHAMEHKYKTFIIEDACRGVDNRLIKERLNDFIEKNGHVIQSNDVKKYLF